MAEHGSFAIDANQTTVINSLNVLIRTDYVSTLANRPGDPVDPPRGRRGVAGRRGELSTP